MTRPPSMPYDLTSFHKGNYLGFPRKSDLRDHISRIVAWSVPARHPLLPDDEALILALLDRHPRAEQKRGSGVRCVLVQDALGGTRRFDLERLDGSLMDFSWHKCMADPKPGQEAITTLQKALRVEVQDQVRAFRFVEFTAQASLGPSGRRSFPCPVLGIPVSWQDMHVDHEPPLTFEVLGAAWLAERGMTASDVRVVNMPEEEFVARLEDRVLAEAWQAWHLERARLRIVSRTANLSTIPKQHRDATRRAKADIA